MRQAYELAWVNACLYCKTTPKISVVDNISFKRPVLIGSLLFLTSQIVYTESNQMQVRVHAETVDPLNPNNREISNDFYFVFTSPISGGSNNSESLPRVVPKTYAESMMYIDGMRHMC
jgi:acyl-coenzyme A thioesterase 9